MSGSHGSQAEYVRGCRCEACVSAAKVWRRRGLPAGDPRHGTLNGYGNFGCTCEACTAANTRAGLAARRARQLAADDPRHGTYNGYLNYRCRCERCRAANSEYARDYYQRSKA